MAQEWYIDAGGRSEGPLSAGELRERAAAGQLGPTDRVSTDRVAWVFAGSVPGLVFSARPPGRPLLETVVSGSLQAGDSTTTTTAPDAPPSIPGYEIRGVLGTGACGVVYRAWHENLKRVVALKTVRLARNTSPDVVERFEQEARALAGLQHPNIVAVYDRGHADGRAYFAMELLDGEDLGARIDRAGPLDERTAWLVARQAAAALAHAAKRGVTHRDVKPANLFLVPAPTGFPLPPDVPMVKVTDFGLALTSGPDDIDQRQTAAGVLLGTPIYMAPEQFVGSSVGPKADVYSLGATVYQALSGQPPFDGRTVWEVMNKKSGPAPRLDPLVSEASADLVAAMLAADAADRPSYVDLIARIDALPCLDGAFSATGLPAMSGRMPVAPAPVVPEPVLPALAVVRPRKRWIYWAALIGLGAVIGWAVLVGIVIRPTTQKVPDGARSDETPKAYTTGTLHLLYTSGELTGWRTAGGVWRIEEDSPVEKTPVITGYGMVVRPFDPAPDFRITLGIDPYTSTTVELQIAATAAPLATRWLVRFDRAVGCSFGKRVGAGPFERVGEVVPIPTPQALTEEERRPYLEVKYERAGGALVAWFRGQALGQTSDAGLTANELRVQTTGGSIRIDYAALEDLAEQK